MPDAASPLPAGGWVDLAGRGQAWVWDTGVPPGGGSAPTLLLLHGWTSTAALNWSACFEPLSRVTRVVAMDHRGHGRGVRAAQPFTLERCADDAAALVERLGAGPVVAGGYSMGGPVAQLLWRRHPELVAGLVLCATAASFGAAGRLPPLVAQALRAGLSRALTAVPASVRDEGIRRLTTGRNDLAHLGAWAAEELGYGEPRVFVQAGAALATFDSTRWIGSCDRPAGVVVTTLDRTVAPARQWALARALPHARALPVAGDHRACVDAAGEFVPAVLAAFEHAAGGERGAQARRER